MKYWCSFVEGGSDDDTTPPPPSSNVYTYLW